MPHIDSLLSLAHKEGANELRIGTNRVPAMFASGAPKRLSIPKTSPDTIRHLMGDLLPPEIYSELDRAGRAEIHHESPGVGPFKITITSRKDPADPGIDIVFLEVKAATKAAAPVGAATAHAEPAPHAAPQLAEAEPRPHPPAEDHRPAPPSAPVTATEAAPVTSSTATLSPTLFALLQKARNAGASDLHLIADAVPVMRVNGSLQTMSSEPACSMDGLLSGLISGPAVARLGSGASVDLSLRLGATPTEAWSYREAPSIDPRGPSPRIRINIYATSAGLAAAIRILPGAIPRLETLGFPLPIADLAELPNGLVILAGPTGSGKSTTLAALLDHALSTRSIAALTLEDPTEYEFLPRGSSIVRQRQIGRDVRDFATGLRDALREDPDVILVGEMRDAESVALAITAAETGHLVLTTVHSRSAASTLERLVNASPERTRDRLRVELADSLRAVVSQRLLPTAHGEGRVMAAEILRVTASVANNLREGKIGGIISAMQAGRREGMITLERSLADLVRKREITVETARATANDRDALVSYLASG